MTNDKLPETSFSIDDLVTLQNDRTGKLLNLQRNYKKTQASRKNKPYFELQLRRLQELYTEFTSAHRTILCTKSETEDAYFKEECALKFEDLYVEVYCEVQGGFEECFPNIATSSVVHDNGLQTVQQNVTSIQLPDIPNPVFSGKITDWPSFYDSFSRLVHQNLRLNAIQKFHFLKIALPGDRDEDIKQMSLSEANYSTAWDMLVKRYDNPRVLFMNQMNNLYALPSLNEERSTCIKSLLTTANMCINEFKRLEIPIETCDHWLAHFLATKLPRETHQAWEYHLGSKTSIPSFADLENFLNNRLVTIDAIENRNLTEHLMPTKPASFKTNQPHKNSKWNKNFKSQGAERKSFHVTTQPQMKSEKCPVCNGNHIIRRCPTFLSKDCYERKSIIDLHKLCLNCLSKTHFRSQCSSSKNCLQCGQRHHTLLHFPINSNIASSIQSSTSNTTASNGAQAASNADNMAYSFSTIRANATKLVSTRLPSVLLATALIPVVNIYTGRTIVLRAFLDQGSEGTLITEEAANALGLKRTKLPTEVKGVGGSTTNSNGIVSFALRSNLNPQFEALIETAFVMDVVTSELPSSRIVPSNWPHILGLQLADPMYFKPNKIDVLIGSEMSASILLPGLKIGRPDQPIAQNSYFGWILFGKTAPTAMTHVNTTSIKSHHITVTTRLESLVKTFFDSDHIREEQCLSDENKWFLEFFNSTTIRQPNGKYMVRLPLKSIFDSNQTLGRSKQLSLNRFQQLERRLCRTPGLMERYTAGINDYFESNQISPARYTENQHCTVTESNKPTVTACVLPHHAVFKDDSLTTKVRIVFDASAKTSNGRSLNDILCVGPALQNELPSVILNWRMHKFAIVGDIKGMFRCIDMHPNDIPYQTILWRNDSNEIAAFCLKTVTFGTASAPCTAISIMHRLADDEKQRYPLAENVLKKEMYVDDVQTGGSTIEATIEIRDQVIAALKSAGMELRKWASNHPKLLESIPVEHQCSNTSLELNSNETIKTLGMIWQPSADVFKFKINFELPTKITKRSVLSTTARLFDPLGLIVPVVIAAKIILKSIWRYKDSKTNPTKCSLDWDDNIPNPIHAQWKFFLQELPDIEDISIPRWINFVPYDLRSIELHVFCDGSLSAYAACVYIRLEYSNGQVNVHLLCAKSKVTPNKSLTVPCIELCGAELSSRLANWVGTQLRTPFNNIQTYFWCDAMIVLYWIKGDINRWKIYVANRINKILDRSSPNDWHHVDSFENPADCATRGLSPKQLASFELWWKGPPWLSRARSNWPLAKPINQKFDEDSLQLKSSQLLVHITIPDDSIIDRYSSFTRLHRITAWILRFQFNARKENRETRRTGWLSVNELNESVFTLVRLVQSEAFGKEIHLIKSKEPLSNKSKIRGLAPFIDSSQYLLLRVRGRLQRSRLPYRQKHPLILPNNHNFTRLLIDHAHKNTLHGGAQLTLANLRQQYWIVSARQAIKAQLQKCIKCFRNNPKISNQMMGNLPYHRVNPPQRPFIATGVDYTGAIELKSSKYRGNTTYKGYIVIFICLASKAIHLEAVTGMQTEHFLMALHRFIGRRGACRDMYSDNGTNFIGANNAIDSSLAERGIQWHFNPPLSPNFGGIWEANIKSAKYHLKRVVDAARLTYEELSTLLVRIESCLNSRPLCPLTSDPEDLSVLTPGHFLIGDSLLAPPPELPDMKVPLTENYIALQRMIQQFWKKWSSDWLSHLQTRPKWHQQQPNIQVHDLVLVKDDKLQPNEWLLGKVVEVHPGADNLVRVATIRTKDGFFKRPVSKLSRLPIGTDANNMLK